MYPYRIHFYCFDWRPEKIADTDTNFFETAETDADTDMIFLKYADMDTGRTRLSTDLW